MRRSQTFIGIDDTDMPDEGGTGRVAREVAKRIARDHPVIGVSRHQLLVDPRVPCTRRNSCKVVHVAETLEDLEEVASAVAQMVLPQCIPGSDPGVCVAHRPRATHPFGRRVQTEIVTQEDARAAARDVEAVLLGLGGTRDGIIGAMAGVLLAAGGNDGRFVEFGACREVRGAQTVAQLLALGFDAVEERDGTPVENGTVHVPERGVRPELRRGGAVVVVDRAADGSWTVPSGGEHHGAGTGGGRWHPQS